MLAWHGALQAEGNVPQSHQAWSTDEGLPASSVHQVFQSQDGYLWLATEGGVARFDGLAFRVLRHETDPAFLSDDISAIAQDASGALWFGTADGLVRSRGTALHRFEEKDGLPSPAILSLAALGDGSVLVLTSQGLVRSDGTRFVPVPILDGTVSSLQATRDGAVWLMTSNGPRPYQHGTFSPVAAGGAASSPSEAIVGLQDGLGKALWTRSPHAVFFDQPGARRVLQIGRDLPGSRLNTMYVDRQGTAWMGTNRGLFFCGPGSASPVHAVEALRSESVLSVLEDREGNVWIGTEASGLHVLRPRKFRSETAAAGEAVTAGTLASDGAVWFGTHDEGVRRLGKGVAVQPVPQSFLTSPVVLSMASGRHGDIWVGTPDGLNHIAGTRVQQYTSASGLPDDFVRSVLVDSRGMVWAGTRQGLTRIEGSKITSYTRGDGLGSNSIGPLLEARRQTSIGTVSATPAELWIGTAAGLSHLRESRIESFAPHGSGNESVVTALAQEDDGTLWVGVHGEGLSRFAGGRFTAIHASALPAEITFLTADRQGYLWMRGVRGVYRVALSAVRACADDNARCDLSVGSYGVPDGMPSDALAAEGTPALWEGNTGDLWLATRKGIAVADPAHLPFNDTPPPVVIQRFLVDEADLPSGAADTEIGPGHRRYTFDYAALSYTLPSRTRYRYMLQGFDKTWLDAGTTRAASYTSLPPGHYFFRVLAQNNDGVWSTAEADVRFHILPPVYRRWWFSALLLLSAAGIAAGIFRLRLRAVQQRFDLVLNERNRVAREIHDTLAQDFVSVSLQLDLTAHMLRGGNSEGAASQLKSTRRLVSEGLDSARQSIWNLRETAASSLPARLTALADRYAGKEHPPRVRVSGAYRKLADSLEKDVFRIAQESLVNSYNHSAATDVLVHLQYQTAVLQLSIEDNGLGFSPADASRMAGHYGLRGMQERAVSLGGTLTIRSSPGEGTAVTLLLPLAGKEDTH